MECQSNCLFEAIKAKIRNPSVKILYCPAFLNEIPCPHFMWLDGDTEYEFKCGRIKWYQWIWHKGEIVPHGRGAYKALMSIMIEKKIYDKDGES